MSDSERRAYETLRGRVDEKFSEIEEKHRAHFACRLGCHSCCQPDLSVSPVEARAIRAWVDAAPGRRERLLRLEAEAPHGESRCALLDGDGGCSIYPVRPLLCRSHGAPTMSETEEGALNLDVCPLNFSEPGALESLPEGDWIHAGTLSTLLALLNQLQGDRGLEPTRIPLRPSALLSDEEGTAPKTTVSEEG